VDIVHCPSGETWNLWIPRLGNLDRVRLPVQLCCGLSWRK